MRTFEQYINEARQNYIFGGTDDRNTFAYNHEPKDKEELAELMEKLIEERGNEGDFNDIDTSRVNDMSFVFEDAWEFNGDISKWDTSQVKDMYGMFSGATSFNQDISKWDTGKVTDMTDMFYEAQSFDQDISNWDISSVARHARMFHHCSIKKEYKPKFKK